MLETLFGKSDAIVALDDDEQVRIANDKLMAATTAMEQLDREEASLLRIKTGKDSASDEELDAAHQRLDVLKGTTSWHLPEAADARREVERLRREHAEVRSIAKARLTEHALEQLRPLVAQVVASCDAAAQLAEQLRVAMEKYGQGGLDMPQYPFPALLQGQLVQFQASLARQIFGLDRSE